jgi:hypothetical protein
VLNSSQFSSLRLISLNKKRRRKQNPILEFALGEALFHGTELASGE